MTDLIGNTNSFGVLALLTGALAAATLRRREWWIIAALLAAMAILIATGAHWLVHDKIRMILIEDDLYGDHPSIQMVITLLGVLVSAGLALWIIHTRRGAYRWAALTTLALIGLFGVQALSVHAVDTLLGRRLGPMMVIGWLWGGAVLMIMIFAAVAHRNFRPYQR